MNRRPRTPRRVRTVERVSVGRWGHVTRYLSIEAPQLGVYGGKLGPSWHWRTVGHFELERAR